MKRGFSLERTILIVEDERSIATLIKYNLEQAGYHTIVAYNGKEALDLVQEKYFDFIVLDLMLPEIDGLQVCKQIREDENDVPILMLTAKSEEESKITGLKSGADDYLTKPFSPKELIARIEAILRRTDSNHQRERESITVHELLLYPRHFQAFLKGQLLDLTRKEFELLVYLAKHKNEIISREQLLHHVWGYDYVGDTRTVDMQVSRLRDKIEKDSKNPQYIKTVWGFGYKLEDPT